MTATKDFLKRYFIEQHELPSLADRWHFWEWPHFVWLGIAAAAAVTLIICFRRSGERGRRKLEIGCGVCLLSLELIRTAFLMIKGQYDVGYLPLHLCGMSVYIEAVGAFFPNRLCRELGWALCMPGAFLALLMPDWTMYEPFVFYPTLCFLLHIMITVFPLMQVAGGRFRPDIRSLPMCFGFLAAAAVPVYFLNKRWGTNFMFTNWAPSGTPLEWFKDLLGTPGYLLGFPVMLAAAWIILYLPFNIRKGCNSR